MGKPMGKPMTKPMSKFATMLQVGRTFGMRDGMLRLEYELQRSSGLMSWRMRSVQGWDSWDLKRIAPGTCAEDMRTVTPRWHAAILLCATRKPSERVSEKSIESDEEKSVLTEAEQILNGNLPFFGQLSLRLRISAAMVPESRHRPECLTASALDADAICVPRLRRSEIYS